MKKLTFLFFLLLLVISCSRKDTEQNSTDNTINTIKEKTLKIAFGGKPRGLDPHMSPEIVSGLLSQQIFNSLVDIDENGDIIPEIAESWEFLDEKTLVFNLKPQIKFHNGEELRASDVVFSINRMKTKPASMVMVEPIQSAEVIEDYKVKINLNKAFSSILYNLAHPRTSILSEKNVNELNDDLSTSGIGTGPFKLISWGTGEEISLERFPEHFLGSPNYEKLIIKVITENSARAMALEAGDINIAYSVAPVDLLNLKNNKNIEIISKPVVLTESITFNFENEKLKDKNLRKAIALAIDRRGIIEAIYNGLAIEANSSVSNVAFGYSKNIPNFPFDSEAAKKIVAENNLLGTKLKITTNDNPTRVQVAQILQSNLREIGIELEIEVVAWATYLQDLGNGNFELKLGGWSGGTGDSDNILYPLYHTNSIGAPGNHGRYSNTELDKLIEKGRTTSNPEERKKSYEEAQQIIHDDIVCVPLYYSMDNVAMDKRIRNFKFRQTFFHDIKDIIIE